MYFLKQLIGALSKPLVFTLILALLGVVAWWFRRRRTAATLFSVAGLITYLASTTLVAGLLLRPLASRYASPLDNPPHVSFVVVLGSFYGPHDTLPVTAALDADGLARIVEGVRLLRILPGARLVVSGGSHGPIGDAPARGYARLAQSLGVDAASIVILDKALDTAEEARYITQVVHTEPFLLVTSADHLPRAVRLMQREGGHPIPAPATRVPPPGEFDWRSLLPTATGLRGTEATIHEYLGLAAISLGLD